MRKRTRQSSRHSNKIASTAPAENQGQVNIDADQQQAVNEEGNSASSKGTFTSLVTNDEHVECEDHTLDLALDTEERNDPIGITSLTETDVKASGNNIKGVGICAPVNEHVEGKEIVAAEITNGCNQNGVSFSLDSSDCDVERCQNSINISKDKDTRDVETKLRVPSNSSTQGELQKSFEIETDMEEITNNVNSYGRVIADGQYCSESRDSLKRRLDEELTDGVSLSQKRTKKFKPPVSTNIARDSCNVNMSITSDAQVQSVAMSKDDHVSTLNNNADEDLNIVNIDILRATRSEKNVIADQSLSKSNVQSKISEDNSITQTKREEILPHDAVQRFEEFHQRTSQRDTDESQSQTLTKIIRNDEQRDMIDNNMSLPVTNNTMSVGQSKSDLEAINYLEKTNENAQGDESVSETKPHFSNLENISMRKDFVSSEKSICIGKYDSTNNIKQCSVEKSKERHDQCSSDMISRQNIFEPEVNNGYKPTSNKIDDPNSIQNSSKTKLISVDDISNTCDEIKELIKVNETEYQLDDKTDIKDQPHDHKDIIDKEIPNQINRASEEDSSKECVISKNPPQSSRSSQDKSFERITSSVENKSSKLQNHHELLMCTQPFTISTQDPNELSQGNSFSFNKSGQLSKEESSSKIVTQPEFSQFTPNEVIATENVKQNHHTLSNILSVNSFAVLTPKSPKFSPKSSQENSTKLVERTDDVEEFSVYSERVLGPSRESSRNDQTGLHPLEYSKDITNVSSALTKSCDSQINQNNKQVDGILDSSSIRPKNAGILTGTLQSLVQKHPSVQKESSCKGHDSKYAQQNSDTTADFSLFEWPLKQNFQEQKAVTDMSSMSKPANKEVQHAEVSRITNDNPLEKNSPVKPNLEQINNCSPTGISESAFSGDNQKVNYHSQFSHCMSEKTSADNILISAIFPNINDVSDMITIKDTFTAGITDSSSNKDILDTSIIRTTGTASDTRRTLPNDKCQATDTNQKVPDDCSLKNISNLSETPGCLPVTGQPVDDMDLTDSQLCEVPAGGEMAVQSDVSTTLARSRNEGKRLVSAIMADLTDVNRQLLRLKREMDAAQRKMNAQNKRTYHPYQQNHQQQTSRPGKYKQSTMGQTRRTF